MNFSGDAVVELTDGMKAVADKREAAVRVFVTTKWPQIVASEIERLALFWSSLQTSEIALGKAKDVGTWNAALAIWKERLSTPDSGLAKIIRIKLGLPTPDDYRDGCS